MESAIRRHDELMRTTIVAQGGHVFKTIGDAFCAAFARPEKAVAAMLEAQRALAGEDFSAVDGLRVRAAIHTGTAEERDGDYFGPAVNRVARLLAIGHGGQILVSGVTADLIQGDLPQRSSLRDLGEHRLRDLSRPEYVYQLLAPDLAATFPPLRSLDTLPNNLPLQLKSFVGRERELAAIAALLEKHRLVTLVGSGGVGKTRTSLQVAANLLDGSGDGVWFVELAPLASGEYLPAAIAQALGQTLAPDGDPLTNLVATLKGKHALLVLDNCEHLVEAASQIIATILRGCPQIRVLASSRQGLGLEGESTYRMPSLVLPDPDEAQRLPTEVMLQYPAITLFVERAGAANDAFSLTVENAPIVADICRRLDGIPLAIELAASRVKMFAPRQIRERLDERFRMLTGGSRDVLPRQQTLRALIDWSHELLDERERTLFRRLGIFVNGFSYEGAVAVASAEDLDEFELFDVLGSLVDKSLVLAEPQLDAVRYRLLESTRAYALEKLEASGERELLAVRHLHHLRERFAASRRRYERTERAGELVDLLGAELEDVRFALNDAVSRADFLGGAHLLAEISTTWTSLGLTTEAIERCEVFRAAIPAGESLLHAKLLAALSFLAGDAGHRGRAAEFAAAAVDRARAAGDVSTLGSTLRYFCVASIGVGHFEQAEKALEEAEALPINTPAFKMLILGQRATLSSIRGDHEVAGQINERLRKAARALGNARTEFVATGNLAETEHAAGRTQRAIELVGEILPRLRLGKDRVLLGTELENLAGYRLALDDIDGAIEAAREGATTLRAQDPEHVYVSIALEHLALACALRGDLVRAAKLEGYVRQAMERHGFGRENTERVTLERLNTLLREGLAAPDIERHLAEGAELASDAVFALAMEDGSA